MNTEGKETGSRVGGLIARLLEDLEGRPRVAQHVLRPAAVPDVVLDDIATRRDVGPALGTRVLTDGPRARARAAAQVTPRTTPGIRIDALPDRIDAEVEGARRRRFAPEPSRSPW